jgi:hypothetical protein
MGSTTTRSRAAGICLVAGAVLLALAAMGPSANAVNVALSGWTPQGGAANWQVEPSGSVVKVVAPSGDFPCCNGSPSMFVSPADVSGTFKINITPNDEVDNDYIGFAVGYTAPINDAACQSTTSCDTSFFLFDWKRSQEMEGNPPAATTDGHEGMSVLRVLSKHDMSNNNTADHINCFWTHEAVPGACHVLTTDFGAGKGYSYGITYSFQVTYTATQLKIVLLGSGGNPNRTIIDVAPQSGTFPAGRVAFYNYSQPNVEYAFDDGTPPTTTTSTTAATTSTTAASGGATSTTRATVGPAVSSSIVRTGQSATLTTVELLGGFVLLVAGALMTAARGRRPDGRFYA